VEMATDLEDGSVFMKTRKKEIVLARQVSIYIIAERLGKNWSEIGRFFNLDHSTIIYAYNTIKNYIEMKDLVVRLLISKAENRIGSISLTRFDLNLSKIEILDIINGSVKDELIVKLSSTSNSLTIPF